MDINYELYKVFYHVATTLSFSEAANKLFISQSAVSQSIKALEKKIKSKAFYQEYQKGTPDTGRRIASSSCGTSYESDSPWRNPAFRSF